MFVDEEALEAAVNVLSSRRASFTSGGAAALSTGGAPPTAAPPAYASSAAVDVSEAAEPLGVDVSTGSLPEGGVVLDASLSGFLQRQKVSSTHSHTFSNVKCEFLGSLVWSVEPLGVGVGVGMGSLPESGIVVIEM